MEAIRDCYGVPAKRNRRVVYKGERYPRLGTITGSVPGELTLRVMLDGDKRSVLLHPTWKLEYIGDGEPEPELEQPPAAAVVTTPKGTPRGEYSKTLLKNSSRVSYMVQMGLGLVMMQERELDENGRREQSALDPNWSDVERFVRVGG